MNYHIITLTKEDLNTSNNWSYAPILRAANRLFHYDYVYTHDFHISKNAIKRIDKEGYVVGQKYGVTFKEKPTPVILKIKDNIWGRHMSGWSNVFNGKI